MNELATLLYESLHPKLQEQTKVYLDKDQTPAYYSYGRLHLLWVPDRGIGAVSYHPEREFLFIYGSSPDNLLANAKTAITQNKENEDKFNSTPEEHDAFIRRERNWCKCSHSEQMHHQDPDEVTVSCMSCAYCPQFKLSYTEDAPRRWMGESSLTLKIGTMNLKPDSPLPPRGTVATPHMQFDKDGDTGLSFWNDRTIFIVNAVEVTAYEWINYVVGTRLLTLDEALTYSRTQITRIS